MLMTARKQSLSVLADSLLLFVVSAVASSAWFIPVMALFPRMTWIHYYAKDPLSSPEPYISVRLIIPIALSFMHILFDLFFRVSSMEPIGNGLKYMKYVLLIALLFVFFWSLLIGISAGFQKGHIVLLVVVMAVLYNLVLVHYPERLGRKGTS